MNDLFRFRVDYVHMETYKMLGGLHRNGRNGEEEFEILGDEDDNGKDANGVGRNGNDGGEDDDN